MTHKIKVLGLAIVALVAMSVAATSAQAAELHATTQGITTITGQQTEQHVFQSSAGNVSCTTASFGGTVQSAGAQVTAQEFTLTPTLAGCTAFGLAAQVKMNGCKYTITNKSAVDVTTAKTGYLDITGCTSGKKIEVIAAGDACTKTLDEQHHLSHVVFENKGTDGTSTEDVLARYTISGITYELHGAFCPGGATTETKHNGTLHGSVTYGAYVFTGTSQVTEHGHQFTKPLDNGVQVGLRAT